MNCVFFKLDAQYITAGIKDKVRQHLLESEMRPRDANRDDNSRRRIAGTGLLFCEDGTMVG